MRPTASEYFPAGQLKQARALADIPIEPAGHIVHSVAPWLANHPMAHVKQLVAAVEEAA